MGGYKPTYTDSNQQPADSRHNPNAALRQRDRDHHGLQYQVDSWRSYRDDATNLQQFVAFANYQPYDYRTRAEQPLGYSNASRLNSAACSFRPMNAVPSQQINVQHQPLRASHGHSQQNVFQQMRPYSNDASSRRALLNNHRSHDSANLNVALQDLPFPSIERHVPQSSSIPTNIRLQAQAGAQSFGQITPRMSSPAASPPPAPSPTSQYLAQATRLPIHCTTPQKLLIVVDLNGTLLKRGASRGTNFVLRPGVTNLMDYLFANHVVMIYTSSRPENATGMVNKLLSPKQRKKLAAVWARDKLDLSTAQYVSKVQVYKKLEKIWADQSIQERAGQGRTWDQSNTVLIDDSHLKALAQPYNLLRVEEFINDRPGDNNAQGKIRSKAHLEALSAWNNTQQQVIRDLEAKLEQLKWTQDVSQLIHRWQKSDSNADLLEGPRDESVSMEPTQLLTPNSPEPMSDDSRESDGGLDLREHNVDGQARKVEHQHLGIHQSDEQGDGVSDRSVSPIDEAVWKDILGGIEQNDSISQTAKSEAK